MKTASSFIVRYTLAVAALCATAVQAQPTAPQFKDYPADAPYTGANHALVIDSEFAKLFRTRLRNALESSKPDFAGRYIVVRWGCGSGGCNMGAVIDAATGHATRLPVVLSSAYPLKPEFEKEDGQELIFKLTSRLMVFAGDINIEQPEGGSGDTVAFYELTKGKFRLVKSLPYGRKDMKAR